MGPEPTNSTYESFMQPTAQRRPLSTPDSLTADIMPFVNIYCRSIVDSNGALVYNDTDPGQLDETRTHETPVFSLRVLTHDLIPTGSRHVIIPSDVLYKDINQVSCLSNVHIEWTVLLK